MNWWNRRWKNECVLKVEDLDKKQWIFLFKNPLIAPQLSAHHTKSNTVRQ